MENRILTVEQMYYLDILGIDISTATFICDERNHYRIMTDHEREFFRKSPESAMVMWCPVFTLQDILDILPFYLYIQEIQYQLVWANPTELQYVESEEREDILIWKDAGDLLDTAYEMLIYLVKNNITKPA